MKRVWQITTIIVLESFRYFLPLKVVFVELYVLASLTIPTQQA